MAAQSFVVSLYFTAADHCDVWLTKRKVIFYIPQPRQKTAGSAQPIRLRSDIL